MNQSKTGKPKSALTKNSERSLLDKVLNDIFERELAAYADSPSEKRADSQTTVKQTEVTVEAKAELPQANQTTQSNISNEHPAMQEFVETSQDRDLSTKEETGEEQETQQETQFEYGEYSDWSYETPRPWLSIAEAARMLGRSPRAVERSILGRWGNKLPEGWTGRKVRIDGQDEWRVVPPPGFRVKHSRKAYSTKETNEPQGAEQADIAEEVDNAFDCTAIEDLVTKESPAPQSGQPDSNEGNDMVYKNRKAEDPFTLEKLLQSASQVVEKELASFGLAVRSKRDKVDKNYEDLEATTIVIDRSDEVEKLLRELADCHRELADERRARLEEMRMMNELQSSIRLLEVNSRETRELKDDLVLAQTALREHKRVYNEFLALPWWKRLFVKNPS
ncbi:MAG: helix-turn-helix domain-containing protein [Candidatus Obscuribacter sp.]|nr:helix-turn-helix domain-containing protein [Candidatus Obscuribacter sp.]MBP6351111.1 helix-turn-helix domain-containing protein [Candidatus Obscuribacter sp.]MBP6594588.1 helix-turn-helix domain-containing protein [Candidatus Obscuribacter sp.]MBP7576403.1 helix-turn-helix domain-containing protein [Candidatus Obscuribacter sp.]